MADTSKSLILNGLEAVCKAYARVYSGVTLPEPPTSMLSAEFFSDNRLDPRVFWAFVQGYYWKDDAVVVAEMTKTVAAIYHPTQSPVPNQGGKIERAYREGIHARGYDGGFALRRQIPEKEQ